MTDDLFDIRVLAVAVLSLARASSDASSALSPSIEVETSQCLANLTADQAARLLAAIDRIK